METRAFYSFDETDARTSHRWALATLALAGVLGVLQEWSSIWSWACSRL